VRAFVPEKLLGTIHVGENAEVHVDGGGEPLTGRISYIAPRAEFTPPVIYSQKMREKFVFMIELTFAPEIARTLHPGQPVDVRLSPNERD
jgi:HlyD family secretion protein